MDRRLKVLGRIAQMIAFAFVGFNSMRNQEWVIIGICGFAILLVCLLIWRYP